MRLENEVDLVLRRERDNFLLCIMFAFFLSTENGWFIYQLKRVLGNKLHITTDVQSTLS